MARRKRKNKKFKILSIFIFIIILIFISILTYLNLLPILYIILGTIGLLLIEFILLIFTLSRKKPLKYIGITLSSILLISLITGIVYLIYTVGFLWGITDGNYTTKNYNVLVLKNSNYSKIDNLNNKDIGINENIDSDTKEDIKDNLDKKVTLNYKEYQDMDTLVDNLEDNNIDSIILEDSELELLEEEDKSSYDNLSILYEFSIKDDIKDLINKVNVNKESFNIYISGHDTYGTISANSRSDVNILMSINPKTEKIQITWIPRDYYVYINDSSYKDKLTHAGVYGVSSSIYAVEKLLDTEINYYLKVNFTSVIKLVDKVGGITVYNEYTFTTDSGKVFNKGNITLNGKDALTYVRERHHLKDGDVGRGNHQVQVLTALINKLKSPSIIKNYTGILSALNGSFVTNMDQNTMTSFIKKEISSSRDWQIDSLTLDGTGAYAKTYTYRNQDLYVMNPNEEIVSTAKQKIKETLEGK